MAMDNEHDNVIVLGLITEPPEPPQWFKDITDEWSDHRAAEAHVLYDEAVDILIRQNQLRELTLHAVATWACVQTDVNFQYRMGGGVAASSLTQLRMYQDALGMTPSAHARITGAKTTSEPPPKANPFQKYGRKKSS